MVQRWIGEFQDGDIDGSPSELTAHDGTYTQRGQAGRRYECSAPPQTIR